MLLPAGAELLLVRGWLRIVGATKVAVESGDGNKGVLARCNGLEEVADDLRRININGASEGCEGPAFADNRDRAGGAWKYV